jgi:hypothetical protein
MSYLLYNWGAMDLKLAYWHVDVVGVCRPNAVRMI